jgi:hypothetical protein
MVGRAKKLLKFAAPCTLCGLAWASLASASPPTSREVVLARVSSDSIATRASTLGSKLGGSWNRPEPRRLDLRPPAAVPANPPGAGEMAANNHADSIPFPSRRPAPAQALDEDQLPAFGNGGPRMRVMSRTEEMVRRVHREGLPIARLWESHSAVVSLGLNQRGKPGLWLMQKIP